MATMSLDKEIKHYLPLLANEEKQSLLFQIKAFLKIKEEPKRLTIEEYNKELEEAEAAIDRGDGLSALLLRGKLPFKRFFLMRL